MADRAGFLNSCGAPSIAVRPNSAVGIVGRTGFTDGEGRVSQTELMPTWGGGPTGRDAGNLKNGKGFLKPHFEVLPQQN